MVINDVIKRNMPVFVIGGITFLVFILIIISASGRASNPTRLIEVSNQEIVEPHTYIKGNPGSKVTVIEFTDYGCPACKSLHPLMENIFDKYSDYIRYGVRHFPLPQHKNADDAAVAAQAAGEQGEFWEYSELLFEFQGDFDEEDLVKYADVLGMDVERFRRDINSDTFKNIVKKDVSFGKKIGINATPTFFINGKQILVQEEGNLEYAIRAALRENGVDPEKIQSDEEKELLELEKAALTEVHALIDQTSGVVEIEYTAEEDFQPNRTEALAGQLVRWTNNSEEDITLVQLMPRFDELEDPTEIKAGETFEFRLRLRESGLWTYQKDGSDKIPAIYIQRIPSELEKVLPDEDILKTQP